MPRSAQQVAKGLLAKGMTQDESHHHMFTKSFEGVTTVITRMSHNGQEIGNTLGNLMAKQCVLRLREFWDLVDCPLSEAEWDALVAERCVNGRNPFTGR